MADLKAKSVALLGSATASMQAGKAKTTVYTVPAGFTCCISHFVVRSPSATLDATGTGSFNFGSGASCSTFRQAVNLDTMTVTTDYMVIRGADVTKYTHEIAGNTIGVLPHATNGAAADNTAIIDLFGYIF